MGFSLLAAISDPLPCALLAGCSMSLHWPALHSRLSTFGWPLQSMGSPMELQTWRPTTSTASSQVMTMHGHMAIIDDVCQAMLHDTLIFVFPVMSDVCLGLNEPTGKCSTAGLWQDED